jgi:AbiJ N-terminal domain 4
MPVFETYASRVASAAKAGRPDVYTYDELPPFLRRQISQIFEECIGSECPSWDGIVRIMDREIESFSIVNYNTYRDCMEYLSTSTDINGVLSLIELCARVMAHFASSVGYRYGSEDPAEGLVELNQRFLSAGVGYQFENGEIIRVDSQYVHAEVVKEALCLLSEPGFEEANTEFMKAHRHLREGNQRDCNTAALRAMETVLKVICDGKGWTYQKGDTVERLLAVVCGKGLFPDYLGGYFTNLVGAMKAGVPKIRDRQGGHGAAPGDDPVPDHIAAFAIHLTAANIVMLVRAYRSLPSPKCDPS